MREKCVSGHHTVLRLRKVQPTANISGSQAPYETSTAYFTALSVPQLLLPPGLR